jgi:hypothetical protein
MQHQVLWPNPGTSCWQGTCLRPVGILEPNTSSSMLGNPDHLFGCLGIGAIINLSQGQLLILVIQLIDGILAQDIANIRLIQHFIPVHKDWCNNNGIVTAIILPTILICKASPCPFDDYALGMYQVGKAIVGQLLLEVIQQASPRT